MTATVTQRVQAPGDWQVDLRDNTPLSVTDAISVDDYGFSHLVVVPTWVDPACHTRTTLLQASRYTGRYITQEHRTSLSGDHVTAWLGDGDGKANSPSADFVGTTPSGQNLTAWVSDILYHVDALNTGVVTGGAAPLKWTWEAGVSQRDALDYLTKNYSLEWRVTNSLTIDVGPTLSLYNLPSVICTPWWDGQDSEHIGMRAKIESDRTVERYCRAIGFGDGTIPNYGVASDPTPTYYDGFGNLVSVGRYEDVPSLESSVEADALATAEGTLDFTFRRNLKITTDHFCPLAHLTPGDYIKVWDPANGVVSVGNEYGNFLLGGGYETHYGGHILWPLITRTYGITMQLRPGMGVYMVRGVDGVIIDLTGYVEWGTGDSTLEVGSDPRRISSAVRRRSITG